MKEGNRENFSNMRGLRKYIACVPFLEKMYHHEKDDSKLRTKKLETVIEKGTLELFKHRVKNKFNYVSDPTSQRVVVRKEVGRGQRGKKIRVNVR